MNILAFGSQAAAQGLFESGQSQKFSSAFVSMAEFGLELWTDYRHLSCPLANWTNRRSHALQPRPGANPYKQVPQLFHIVLFSSFAALGITVAASVFLQPFSLSAFYWNV